MTRILPKGGPSRSPEDVVTSIDINSFDWATYKGSYKGRALITRLHHIPALLLGHGSKPILQSTAIARAALVRLIPEIKTNTWDHQLYLQVVAEVENAVKRSTSMDVETDGLSPGESQGVPDMDWVEETSEAERREGTRLDVELRGYLSNLIKESIRLTYLAAAQLSVKVGSAPNAMKNYNSAREHSTSPAHLVELGLGILESCLVFNQPNSLPGHISKLEAALDRLHPPIVPSTARNAAESTTANDLRETREREAKSQQTRLAITTKIKVAKVFLYLNSGDYSRVSREIDGIIENGGLGTAGWEGVVISSSDLGLIGAVCGLASLERGEVRRRMVEKTGFRNLLDDTQGWILDMVRSFVEARYGEVMTMLETAERDMVLNPLLSPHTSELKKQIKTRSIIQYILPFSTIQISTMANAFSQAPEDMMSTVEELVEGKQIVGKIDLIDQVLVIKSVNARGALFRDGLEAGRNTSETTRAALFRMKLIESKIIVKLDNDDQAKTRSKGLAPSESSQPEFGGTVDDEEEWEAHPSQMQDRFVDEADIEAQEAGEGEVAEGDATDEEEGGIMRD